MRPIAAFLFASLLIAASTASPAQQTTTVVWVPSTAHEANVGAGAFIVGGLIDAYMAGKALERSTVLSYSKIGIRPPAGESGRARAGEVFLERFPYRASFIAKPRKDYIDDRGFPVSAERLRLVKMINSEFCFPNGSKCWRDLNRDGEFDSAAKGWKGVPYEVFEVREKDLMAGSRQELAIEKISEGRVELVFREYLAEKTEPYRVERCAAAPGSAGECFGFRFQLGSIEGDSVDFVSGAPAS